MDNVFALLEREEQAAQKLLRDMVDACCTLQRLIYFRNASEAEEQLYRGIFYSASIRTDEYRESNRNTMISAYLQAKGYVLSDPAILNSGQKHALDMDIRRTGSIPWTFCEAINLHSGAYSRKQFSSALEKTIAFAGKYALPFYYLIGYVNADPAAFTPIVSELRIELSAYCNEEDIPQSQTDLAFPQDTVDRMIQGTEMIYDCNGFPVKIYILFVLTGKDRRRLNEIWY